MKLTVLAGLIVTLIVPSTVAVSGHDLQRAQLPAPFGKPVIPGQQCVPESQKILKLQLEAFKALQKLSRRDGEKLCASLEDVDQMGVQKFLDPKAIEPLLTQQQLDIAKIGARVVAIDTEIASIGRHLDREGNASGEDESRRDLELEREVFGQMTAESSSREVGLRSPKAKTTSTIRMSPWHEM